MATYTIVTEIAGVFEIAVTGTDVPAGYRVAVRDPDATARKDLLALCQHTADEAEANFSKRAARERALAP